jgi:peptide/nickel transport system substrate-binding protein
MPLLFQKRARRLALLLAIPMLVAGCKPEPQGELKVMVIGEKPELVDPSVRPPTAAGKVLLANVAQGLVRFDASGQIVPGLAERWNVSDDGLSYIFRLSSGEWASGRKITAQQVARILRRAGSASNNNPLADTLGAIDEIVAMTDRVLEIRLKAPRPNLLQLLAQPELALIHDGNGTGPFQIDRGRPGPGGELRLQRLLSEEEEEEQQSTEELLLGAGSATQGVQAFTEGRIALLLGGDFTNLPLARSASLARGALRFDPVGGLFGLVPTNAAGPLQEPEVRRLLAQAIDRDALVRSLAVPGLVGRATVLEPGLDFVPAPASPQWAAIPLAERRAELAAEADRLFGADERPVLKVWAPEGPGAEQLLNRIAEDWALLGIGVERADNERSADLKLIDSVAPSNSPAWFLRHFRCEVRPICDEQVDALLEAARGAPIAAQRGALLAEAARRIDELQLFLPITAPVRWSLVSERVQGFAGNRFGHHSLVALEQQLPRQGSQ